MNFIIDNFQLFCNVLGDDYFVPLYNKAASAFGIPKELTRLSLQSFDCFLALATPVKELVWFSKKYYGESLNEQVDNLIKTQVSYNKWYHQINDEHPHIKQLKNHLLWEKSLNWGGRVFDLDEVYKRSAVQAFSKRGMSFIRDYLHNEKYGCCDKVNLSLNPYDGSLVSVKCINDAGGENLDSLVGLAFVCNGVRVNFFKRNDKIHADARLFGAKIWLGSFSYCNPGFIERIRILKEHNLKIIMANSKHCFNLRESIEWVVYGGQFEIKRYKGYLLGSYIKPQEAIKNTNYWLELLEAKFDKENSPIMYSYITRFWNEVDKDLIDNALKFVCGYNTASKSKMISIKYNSKRKRFCSDISYLRVQAGYSKLFYTDAKLNPTDLCKQHLTLITKSERNIFVMKPSVLTIDRGRYKGTECCHKIAKKLKSGLGPLPTQRAENNFIYYVKRLFNEKDGSVDISAPYKDALKKPRVILKNDSLIERKMIENDIKANIFNWNKAVDNVNNGEVAKVILKNEITSAVEKLKNPPGKKECMLNWNKYKNLCKDVNKKPSEGVTDLALYNSFQNLEGDENSDAIEALECQLESLTVQLNQTELLDSQSVGVAKSHIKHAKKLRSLAQKGVQKRFKKRCDKKVSRGHSLKGVANPIPEINNLQSNTMNVKPVEKFEFKCMMKKMYLKGFTNKLEVIKSTKQVFKVFNYEGFNKILIELITKIETEERAGGSSTCRIKEYVEKKAKSQPATVKLTKKMKREKFKQEEMDYLVAKFNKM